jgi:hypothetical protein
MMTPQECTKKIQELIDESIAEMIYDGVDITARETHVVINIMWRFVKKHNQILKEYYEIGK